MTLLYAEWGSFTKAIKHCNIVIEAIKGIRDMEIDQLKTRINRSGKDGVLTSE